MDSAYPLSFRVDYPDHDLDRVSSLLRPLWALPILIVLGSVGAATWAHAGPVGIGSGLIVLAPILMIVFRRKYPYWWFAFNREWLRFSSRVGAYLALMDDAYPSTDEQQHVHIDVDYPDVAHDLNRWLPLVKWFLAIPHYVVLAFLWVGAVLAVLAAWVAIVFTGRYPHRLFDYVEGVMRWQTRVVAYAALLVTDRYPPFSLAP